MKLQANKFTDNKRLIESKDNYDKVYNNVKEFIYNKFDSLWYDIDVDTYNNAIPGYNPDWMLDPDSTEGKATSQKISKLISELSETMAYMYTNQYFDDID